MSILKKQSDTLMELARIPAEYRPEMSKYVQDEIKKSGKSIERLIELLGHPCTKDLLGSSITGLKERLRNLESVLDKSELDNHRKNILMGIASVLGSGYDAVMKNELEYKNGRPVGVAEGTRDRHPLCDSALSGRQRPEGFTKRAGLRKKARKTRRLRR